MKVSDEFADKSFAIISEEIENNLTNIESDALGGAIVPLLMESGQHGRTRNIRINSMKLLKKVLVELSTRDDCRMAAVERTESMTDEDVREAMDSAYENQNPVQPLLDTLEKQIQKEEAEAKALENVSVDAILNAPLHPDAAGR